MSSSRSEHRHLAGPFTLTIPEHPSPFPEKLYPKAWTVREHLFTFPEQFYPQAWRQLSAEARAILADLVMSAKPISYVLPRSVTLPALRELKSAGLADFEPRTSACTNNHKLIREGWTAHSKENAKALLSEVLQLTGLKNLFVLHQLLLEKADSVNRSTKLSKANTARHAERQAKEKT